MSKHQEIQNYLQTVPCATLDDIYDNVSFYYYANHKKHLGAIMSRMVKSGKVERIKKGLFRYIDAYEFVNNLQKDKNQTTLFKD